MVTHFLIVGAVSRRRWHIRRMFARSGGTFGIVYVVISTVPVCAQERKLNVVLHCEIFEITLCMELDCR